MKALEAKQTLQAIVNEKPDGVIGQKTLAAVNLLASTPNEAEWPPVAVVAPAGEVDARSEKAIATLHPKVRPLARALVKDAAAKGIEIRVTSGTRTYEEQNALYEQGRSKPGRIVTNARGGHSNHNFGIAFDVTIFKNGQPVWESPQYKVVGALGKALGFTWGGDWESIQDEPHFELHPDWAQHLSEGEMLTKLRQRHSDGADAFA